LGFISIPEIEFVLNDALEVDSRVVWQTYADGRFPDDFRNPKPASWSSPPFSPVAEALSPIRK